VRKPARRYWRADPTANPEEPGGARVAALSVHRVAVPPLDNESLMSRCVAVWVDRTGMGHTVVGRLLLGHTLR
jgi:hypothetical protein